MNPMLHSISSQSLARLITALLFIAALAGSWDAWWHSAVGRETFWEPPHLLLYASTLFAISGGAYGWHVFRERVWKRLSIVLFLIPLSAPFDNLWHAIFGVEDLRSPFVIWSPPHLILIFALVGSFAMLLPIVKRDTDVYARPIFGAIAFASMLALLALVVSPLEPIGPWHLLGFWGAGFVAFVFVLLFLSAREWAAGFGGALLMIAFYTILFTAGSTPTDAIAPGVEIPPHDHPPAWLTIFSLLLPATAVEYGKRMPLWLQGIGGGALWSVLLYGFSSRFLEPEFQYGDADAFIAIFASILGGLCAGIAVQKLRRRFTTSV